MNKELSPLEALKKLSGLARDKYSNVEVEPLFNIIETALKDYDLMKELFEGQKHNLACLMEENRKMKQERQALKIIKENLNIDEILLAVKGVCKASDYDLVKKVLL